MNRCERDVWIVHKLEMVLVLFGVDVSVFPCR